MISALAHDVAGWWSPPSRRGGRGYGRKDGWTEKQSMNEFINDNNNESQPRGQQIPLRNSCFCVGSQPRGPQIPLKYPPNSLRLQAFGQLFRKCCFPSSFLFWEGNNFPRKHVLRNYYTESLEMHLLQKKMRIKKHTFSSSQSTIGALFCRPDHIKCKFPEFDPRNQISRKNR